MNRTEPTSTPKSEVHISERLSQMLTQTTTSASNGATFLQRSVLEGDASGETNKKKNLVSTEPSKIDPTRCKTVPLPSPQSRPVPLVTTAGATSSTGSSSSTQRLSLPIIHGQNGQLLMLMNQTDLVRLAQESALSQMLSLAASRTQTAGSVPGPSVNETSSNESTSGAGGTSILANVVAPISPLGGDGGGVDSPTGLLVEGGHSSGGPGSSDRALRRKSVHNEVEKRRRQKINMWIEKLSAIIPPAPNTTPEQQQAAINSNSLSCKADVLQRTYDYVIQISKAHNELTQVLSLVQQENELLRSELARLTGNSNGSSQGQSPVQVMTTQRRVQQETARSASPDTDSVNSNPSSPAAAARHTDEERQHEQVQAETSPQEVSPLTISPAPQQVLVASSSSTRPGTVALVLPLTTAALTSSANSKRLSLPSSSSTTSTTSSSSILLPLALTTTTRHPQLSQQSPVSQQQQPRKRRGDPIESDDTS